MSNAAEPTSTVCLAMPKYMNEAIEQIAKLKIRSKSDIIRDAIVFYFASDPVAKEIYDKAINGVVPETIV